METPSINFSPQLVLLHLYLSNAYDSGFTDYLRMNQSYSYVWR